MSNLNGSALLLRYSGPGGPKVHGRHVGGNDGSSTQRVHGIVMRFSFQNLDTGWGELMCFVLAWVVGVGAIWADYVGRSKAPSGDRIAANGRAEAPAYFD